MKKIKVAMIASNLDVNGITSVIMNYCRNINLSIFEITIFAGSKINKIYASECEKLGIKIIELPSKQKQKIMYYLYLFKKIPFRYFDVIHVHGNSSVMFFDLFIGFLKGIKKRIAHCHNTFTKNMRIHKLLKYPLKKICTDCLSCGKLAGDWIFGENNYTIILNGIDTKRFKFDDKIRKDIRKQLNLEKNEILLGHVGKICEQKNQDFLIKVFERLVEDNKSIKLLMIGNGSGYEDLKNKIENSSFKDNVILYGESNWPEKFYMAMDLYVFPSIYEGFPVTLVEAQVSGLQCIISDAITLEAVLTDRTDVESLSIERWVKKIKEIRELDRINFYEENEEMIDKFDIKNCVEVLENCYLNNN